VFSVAVGVSTAARGIQTLGQNEGLISDEVFTSQAAMEGARGNPESARSACSGPGRVALSPFPGHGILSYAKSRSSKSEEISLCFGVIDGGVCCGCSDSHDIKEGGKRLSDRKCAHEEADAAVKRTSAMVGPAGRFPLFENVLGMRGAS
jgi:hypothetical protein